MTGEQVERLVGLGWLVFGVLIPLAWCWWSDRRDDKRLQERWREAEMEARMRRPVYANGRSRYDMLDSELAARRRAWGPTRNCPRLAPSSVLDRYPAKWSTGSGTAR